MPYMIGMNFIARHGIKALVALVAIGVGAQVAEPYLAASPSAPRSKSTEADSHPRVGPRADACGFSDGLRRLPNLNLPYNSLSTVWRQTGILVHVHPVLPWNLKSQQPQLPRSEPDGQPAESSHLVEDV